MTREYAGGALAWRNQIASKIGTRDASDVDMHANQLTVSLETVRKLVDVQFPEWRDVYQGSRFAGTVNALFRIGDKFLARFPLEPGDVGSMWRWLQSEAQAARELLGRTRFPAPEQTALKSMSHSPIQEPLSRPAPLVPCRSPSHAVSVNAKLYRWSSSSSRSREDSRSSKADTTPGLPEARDRSASGSIQR